MAIVLGMAVLLGDVGISDAQLFRRFRRSWGGGRVVTRQPTVSSSQYRNHALIKFIRQQQDNVYVGRSWGTEDYQCFTWTELTWLKQDIREGRVQREIEADPAFPDLVAKVREMEPAARNALFNLGRRIYRPTWRQIGGIGPAGQTDAGQIGERLVAGVIVDLVQKSLD